MKIEKFLSSTWRVVKTPPAPGAWNMAVDEAILAAIGRQDVPPTLRLFAWNPVCLSLGYAQPFSDVDDERLAQKGWDVVRRVTGGRAILHTDELTYSVIGPHGEPRLAGSVLESYQRLSQALLAALNTMALPAQALPKNQNPSEKKQPEPVCFEVPSNYEITVSGKKLIGSAQARKNVGILQHGTLPLAGNLARITEALHFKDADQRNQAGLRLLDRATTVEAVLQQSISWERAAEAFISAFEDVLNLSFEESALTAKELTHADILVKEKYAHPEWTERI
jgi:lipoyl(octanoyl) transferase